MVITDSFLLRRLECPCCTGTGIGARMAELAAKVKNRHATGPKRR